MLDPVVPITYSKIELNIPASNTPESFYSTGPVFEHAYKLATCSHYKEVINWSFADNSC